MRISDWSSGVCSSDLARESGVLVQGRTASSPSTVPDGAGTPTPTPTPAAGPTLDPDRDPNAQGRKAQFVGTLDRSDDVNPHTLTAAPSPYLLSAGSVISASLITGLRSALPGLVTAKVTAQVLDRKRGVLGQKLSVRVDLGGRRILTKKTQQK